MEGTGEGCGFFCSPKSPYLSTMSQQFVADCSLLKNYFSFFIQDFWSSPSFLAFKSFISPRSFNHPAFGFPSFLAVSSTDKPINRSIHDNAPTQRNVFTLRGLIFRDIHKKQGKSSNNSGYKIQKICGWKIYSRTRTFRAEVHKLNIRVKRQHNKDDNSDLV